MKLNKLGETTDYQIAEGSTDIRGWDFADEQNVVVGKVEDLLFDPHHDDIAFALVALPDRHIQFPIGGLGFDHDARRVLALGVPHERLLELPSYGDGDGDVVPSLPMYNPSALPARIRLASPIPRTAVGLAPDATVYDGLAPLPASPEALRSQRELSFSGSEPSERELAQREHLSDLGLGPDGPIDR